jgi:transcriptional regulator of acetoin/glycerol metabolism
MSGSSRTPSHGAKELGLKRRVQLADFIERAFAYAQGPVITREDLPEAVLQSAHREDGHGFRAWKRKTLERLEREFLTRALAAHGGNVSRAARALGLHRTSLQRLMRGRNLPAAPSPSDPGSLRQAQAD